MSVLLEMSLLSQINPDVLSSWACRPPRSGRPACKHGPQMLSFPLLVALKYASSPLNVLFPSAR